MLVQDLLADRDSGYRRTSLVFCHRCLCLEMTPEIREDSPALELTYICA